MLAMAESTRDAVQASPGNRLPEQSDTILRDVKDTVLNSTEDAETDVSLLKNNNLPLIKKGDDANKEENDEEHISEGQRDVPIDRGWAWVIVVGCFGMHVLVLGAVKSFGVLFVEFKDKYNVTARELGMVQGVVMTIMMALGIGANVLAVRFSCQKVVFIGGVLSALGFIASAFIPSFNILYVTYGLITGLGFAMSYSPSVVMVGIHFKKRRSLANGISLSGSGVGSFVLPNLMRWMLKEYGLNGCLLILGGLMLNVCVCALLFRPLTSYPLKKNVNKKYAADGKSTDHQHLMNNSKEKTPQMLKDTSNLQVRNHYEQDSDHQTPTRDHHLQVRNHQTPERNHNTPDDSKPKPNLHVNEPSDFSSCEFVPMASLQSIPQEEMEEMASGLCAKLKCSNCQKGPKKQGAKKGPKLFNWSLLSNPLFMIYAGSCALGNFAYPNIFLMLPAFAENNGQDRDTSALLVSIIGISDLIGRLFFGWFSDLKLFPRRYGFVGCMAISAFFNLVAPVMTSFGALVTYAALYGLFAGSYLALISVMLVDALGIEKLSSAYGLVLLLMSFGLLPGPLICGGIRDATSKWDNAFILCGIMALIGSIFPLFEPCAKRYMDARGKKKVKNSKKTQSYA